MSAQSLLLRIPAILIALTIHEFAHGWTALRCGDDTAKQAGRLTLNPLAHLDLFGTIMLLFGPFGWARPVPINPYKFTNQRRGIVLVSVAGPAANILCALAGGYFFRFFLMNRAMDNAAIVYLSVFFQLFIMINLGLSFFNLLPVPPLDGSKIAMGLLPSSQLKHYYAFARYAPKIFLFLIVTDWLYREFHIGLPLFSYIIYPLFNPYYRFWMTLVFG